MLNRANARRTIFETDGDYAAFERVLAEAVERACGIRLLTYCVMPNHWHLVVWPTADGQLSTFMNWLTLTHTQRYRHAHGTVGHGAVYQGRFKSFPVQADHHHFLILCRYVERNPLRAALVQRAEDWRWSGLWRRQQRDEQGVALLSEWPIERPAGWLDLVNDPQTDAEVEAVRTSVRRGRPLGQDTWQRDAARRLGLEASLRPPGRPRKVLAPTAG